MTTPPSKPTQLGKYEIIEELGRGGFGVVYRALNPDLQHEVSLKVIHPQLLVEPRFVEHFFREARIAARLGEAHPNFVTIHDIAQSEGRLFIVMALLDAQPPNWLVSARGRLALGGIPPILELAPASPTRLSRFPRCATGALILFPFALSDLWTVHLKSALSAQSYRWFLALGSGDRGTTTNRWRIVPACADRQCHPLERCSGLRGNCL